MAGSRIFDLRHYGRVFALAPVVSVMADLQARAMRDMGHMREMV